MKQLVLGICVLVVLSAMSSCARNYYSSKASKNCGCPGQNVR
jgi:hypothetical protein